LAQTLPQTLLLLLLLRRCPWTLLLLRRCPWTLLLLMHLEAKGCLLQAA
jgi:hypothetical protein